MPLRGQHDRRGARAALALRPQHLALERLRRLEPRARPAPRRRRLVERRALQREHRALDLRPLHRAGLLHDALLLVAGLGPLLRAEGEARRAAPARARVGRVAHLLRQHPLEPQRQAEHRRLGVAGLEVGALPPRRLPAQRGRPPRAHQVAQLEPRQPGRARVPLESGRRLEAVVARLARRGRRAAPCPSRPRPRAPRRRPRGTAPAARAARARPAPPAGPRAARPAAPPRAPPRPRAWP